MASLQRKASDCWSSRPRGRNSLSITSRLRLRSVHARAPQAEDTDWAAIVSLYDLLMSVRPSPVVALNRAIAIAQQEGPERGLEVIGTIEDRDRLAGYPFIRRRLASLSCAADGTTRRASTSVRRWRWPATRWSGSSSNSALARANEAIRPSRLFWNQQLVCREKSQAEKRSPDFIRG